ncbi:sugar ABC transporter substrate-binding protein [Paenibacillus dendritiformis]|uniref:Maltodextrin-binding protein n=1 Tax=Paenibacillus dendritiformis C454 TaxID=1131935 RepID=H3SEF2_9BACL|nr:maltose ABC transporter substrate-binding protein [Paenibacillus dendritiformis]EHQ62533.1 family 1 extracellular solute-binding protein [Paenibacillus dendritiformis C454]CAH8772361.1 maltose ABC transporter substrate-binding protein [Paenibacillus dendritiformis]
MSRRFFISILSSALVFLLLAACSVQNTKSANEAGDSLQQHAGEAGLQPEKGAKLLVWESKGPELDFLKAVAEDFEKEYGVNVTVEAVPAIDSVTKLATDGPAGIGADVFSAPHDHLGNAVMAGLVLQNDVYDEPVKQHIMDSALEGVSYDGVLYGFPTAIDTYALYYNKKMLNQAPATYEELIQFAQTYNDPKNKQYAFMWNVGQLYQTYSFLAGYGGYIFGDGGKDAGDIGLSNAGSVAGAAFLQSLKNILPINSNDINDNIITGFFIEGKTAAIIGGPWLITDVNNAGLDYGVAPLPLLPNGEHPRSLSGIRALYVSSYTEYPAAAKLFASYATSRQHIVKRYEMTMQLPPRQDMMEEPIIKQDANALAFLEQTKYSVPMPSIPEMGNVWVPAGAALAAIWNDKQEPEMVLKKAVEQINTAIRAKK